MDREELRQLVVRATGGCEIQHDGWPCNSCFHAIPNAIPELELERHIHDYWLAVLAYRGDYDDIEPEPELLDELYQELQKHEGSLGPYVQVDEEA